MRITTKSRYGLRALLDLAKHSDEKPVRLENIAKRQDLSVKYLEHLFKLLTKKGLIKGFRGARGGYVLSKTPEKITLREIIETLDGKIKAVHCVDDFSACEKAELCVSRDVWSAVTQDFSDALESITLASLLEKERLLVKKTEPVRK